MSDQIPEYEQSNLIQKVMETGELPDNMSEEELKALYENLLAEGRNLITTSKSLENTMSQLLGTLNVTAQSTSVQMGAFIEALEMINSAESSIPQD